jgi:HK97 family phage prohead protease
MKIETRFLKGGELRAQPENKIIGYAAIFDSLSEDLGGFVERIRAGCFARAIKLRQDCRALFNHDPSVVFGRVKNGTLRLAEDSVGLHFECDLPNTQTARDCHASIARGDIDQCSFSFTLVEDKWSNGGKMRELLDVNLIDVSPVTFPAYEDTSVAARSLKYEGRVGMYQFTRAPESHLYVSEAVEDEKRLLKAQILQEQIRIDTK